MDVVCREIVTEYGRKAPHEAKIEPYKMFMSMALILLVQRYLAIY